jgi:hypothetical protein
MNSNIKFLSRGILTGLFLVSGAAMAIGTTMIPTSPVPLDMTGKNVNTVKLGSYYVNAIGNCASCHSTVVYKVGTDPFKGQPVEINTATYLSGGKKYAKDTITSANLTPDANGNPAGLTLKQFVAVMKKGTDPEDATKLVQIHPWPVYKNMTYSDLNAIYQYLRAIPPLEMGVVAVAATTPVVTTPVVTTPAAATH